MKQILISVKPKYVAKILNGEKTIEIRKTCPSIFKDWECDKENICPVEVYIYCTKEDSLGRIKELPKDRYFVDCVETPQDFAKMDSGYEGKGKVVAKFTLNKVGKLTYQPYRDSGTLLVCKASCLTDEELDKYGNKKDLYVWFIDNLEIFDRPKELSEFEYETKTRDNSKGYVYELKTLTKAPQDFMYIEVEN